MSETTQDARTTVKRRLAVAALALPAVLATAYFFNGQQLLRTALGWIDGLGPTGVLLYVALYVVACVLCVPGSLLTLGAGVVFGVIQGSALVSVASTLGATAAFLVGRYLARDWVACKLAGSARFRAVDEAVAGEGWKIVVLTRLSPVFPFNLLNYAYGLTRVSLREYFFASWLGMLPGTILYVYIGSLAGDLARLGVGQRPRAAGEWVLYGVGLASTVAVAAYATRIARAVLAKKV